MVIEIVSVAEFQERIDYLLGRARLTAAGASKEIGTSSFFESLLRRDRPPKTIDPKKCERIAELLSGRGRLIDDQDVLFRFLLGLENDYNVVLRGRDSNPQPTGIRHLVLVPQLAATA